MNIYQEKGYDDRAEYLSYLSEDLGIPLEVVQEVADLLGSGEDFDGLRACLEDFEGGF